jgi:ABC-type cobalt transport system, permease component CbiQ and related transporters
MLTRMDKKETYIHGLDIRTKLFIFIFVIVVTFLFNNPVYNLALIALLLIAVLPSGIPLKGVLNMIKPLLLVFSIIIVMTCFTAQPAQFKSGSSKLVLFYLFPGNRAAASLGGLLLGITYLMRIFLMVLATSIFTITTPIDEILQLFHKMKAPYGLSIVVTTSISFIPTMALKKNLIFQAQKARGASISGKGVIGQLKAFVPIMIPLIINSILLANNLAISMLNRGYGASKTWTSLTDIKMRGKDYMAMLVNLCILGACIYIRYGLNYGVL